MLQFMAFMAFSLALGFKHSYDSDHLIAVSNILRKVDSIKSSIKIGLSWAIGHMLTASIITIILFIFKESFLNNVFPHFEKIVGLMLIVLGFFSLKEIFVFHSHRHSHGSIVHSHPHLHLKHDKEKHFHTHMFGIGVIHGFASNDELLLLFTASLAVTSIGGLLVGLSIFSIGVVLGMILFTFLFSYPLLKIHSEKIYKYVSFATGSAGIIYGTLMLFAIL